MKKFFFGFRKCYSVTAMLFELGLPSFATVMHNYRHSFYRQWTVHCKPLVVHMRCVCFGAFLPVV